MCSRYLLLAWMVLVARADVEIRVDRRCAAVDAVLKARDWRGADELLGAADKTVLWCAAEEAAPEEDAVRVAARFVELDPDERRPAAWHDADKAHGAEGAVEGTAAARRRHPDAIALGKHGGVQRHSRERGETDRQTTNGCFKATVFPGQQTDNQEAV